MTTRKMLPKSAALLDILKDAMPASAISNRWKTSRLHFKKIDGEKILKLLSGVIDEICDNDVDAFTPKTICAHVFDTAYFSIDEAREILNTNTEKMVLCAALVGGEDQGNPNEYYLKIWEIVNRKVAREIWCEVHDPL